MQQRSHSSDTGLLKGQGMHSDGPKLESGYVSHLTPSWHLISRVRLQERWRERDAEDAGGIRGYSQKTHDSKEGPTPSSKWQSPRAPKFNAFCQWPQTNPTVLSFVRVPFPLYHPHGLLDEQRKEKGRRNSCESVHVKAEEGLSFLSPSRHQSIS